MLAMRSCRGHISDQHAPPGIVSAPHTCLNVNRAVHRLLFLSRHKRTHICSTLVTGLICSKAAVYKLRDVVAQTQRENVRFGDAEGERGVGAENI